MTVSQSILLGLIQGVTEFLPISSSGHLAIFKNVFNVDTASGNMFFDVLLHLATLVSVLIVYRRDITGIVLELLTMVRIRKLPDGQPYDAVSRRTIAFIITGTLPLILALAFKDRVEALSENMFFIALALAVTGILLFLSDRFSSGYKNAKNATVKDAFFVGLCQMLAVVPGLSRSGVTISAGLYRKFDRSFAVKFSFLLSIPAILGAVLVSFIDAVQLGIDWSLMPVYLIGMAAAGISGYFSIRLLHIIANKRNFGAFSYYCWGAAIFTAVMALVA